MGIFSLDVYQYNTAENQHTLSFALPDLLSYTRYSRNS